MPKRPTLILLPAMPCGIEFYAAQMAALSDIVDPQVMVLDAPAMEESASTLLNNAPARFLIAGTAYGGRLAIEVAAMAPERIMGMWLMNCDPGPHPEPAAALEISTTLRASGSETIVAEWGPIIVHPDHAEAGKQFTTMATHAPATRFANQYEASARRVDRWNDLSRIAAPTLLIWGEEDPFVSVLIGHRMAQTLPSARFIGLQRCCHLPTLEKPEICNAEARVWITDCVNQTID